MWCYFTAPLRAGECCKDCKRSEINTGMKLLEVITDDEIEQFKQAFHMFMNSKLRNQWLGGDVIQVYMRKGIHVIGRQAFKTLDIANIQIDESERGKGVGMRLIDWLHEQNPFEVTYVESLQNLRLYASLKQRGWIDVPNSQPPSVYKTK